MTGYLTDEQHKPYRLNIPTPLRADATEEQKRQLEKTNNLRNMVAAGVCLLTIVGVVLGIVLRVRKGAD